MSVGTKLLMHAADFPQLLVALDRLGLWLSSAPVGGKFGRCQRFKTKTVRQGPAMCQGHINDRCGPPLITEVETGHIHIIPAIFKASAIDAEFGKLAAILYRLSSTRHQCATGKSQGFFPGSKLVYASTLDFSSGAPLSGGIGLGFIGLLPTKNLRTKGLVCAKSANNRF